MIDKPLTAPSAATTMSSREISELTGKHYNLVVRDIRRMLKLLGLTAYEFSTQVVDELGCTRAGFNLTHDLTMTLVSGYSVAMRYSIVTRWEELEHQVPAVIQAPSALRETLLHALLLVDRIDALKAQVALLEAHAADVLCHGKTVEQGIAIDQIKASLINIANNLGRTDHRRGLPHE